MEFNSFIEVVVGSVVVIIAAVLGAYLSARYTHKFQDLLLEKQLAAQVALFEEQKEFQAQLVAQQQDFDKNQRKNDRYHQMTMDVVNRARSRVTGE